MYAQEIMPDVNPVDLMLRSSATTYQELKKQIQYGSSGSKPDPRFWRGLKWHPLVLPSRASDLTRRGPFTSTRNRYH
ncbi:hypothetical protein EYZ11_009197 [Aspergillus tanneri]|uniref:Uncharacterized protein n=1 Tax=Aspergillus tanneri TaxID=1220188 RepID=A0A4S3J8W4_9EURO|nr:hypothetical protein EYZ11_009197 [Aspergillus tanneri]